LGELRQACLYLHFDGVRYCFKQDPNVTLLIEQEADAVARDEGLVTRQIKDMLEERLAGHHAAISWPSASGEIPDEQPRFQIAYLPLDFATKPAKEKDALASEFLEKCGSRSRIYKNGLALAIPATDQTEILRREVRYFIAVDQVGKAAKRHKLTKEQTDELRERKATHASAAESAFVKLYPEVWLPKLDQGTIAVEKIAVGGRPLTTTVNEKHLAMIFERSMELLTVVQSRVFTKLNPVKIVELFKLGEGQPPRLGIRCADVVSGFYSFLGYTRLTSKEVVQKAVARGVQEGVFGYFAGAVPVLDAAGKYQVARSKVRFDVSISDDEVDLESGFLMLPQAIPADVVPPPGVGPVHPDTTPQPGITSRPEPGSPSPLPAPADKVVQLSFTANRDQIYTAWNAIANLAEMAGKVEVSIRAESEKGFDKSKLQNGVLEPLREIELID
jgi:hypothetical protein